MGPLIPPAKLGGNNRVVGVRAIINSLMYILGTGGQWRDIPKNFPPCSTLHDYLDRWEYDGTLNHTHLMLCRELAKRQPSPTPAVIDSQGVKGAENARKTIKGKKRHIAVDTTGLLMHVIMHAAHIQDRDGGTMLTATMVGLCPFLLKLYAVGGY